jgi:hypothetical protein
MFHSSWGRNRLYTLRTNRIQVTLWTRTNFSSNPRQQLFTISPHTCIQVCVMCGLVVSRLNAVLEKRDVRNGGAAQLRVPPNFLFFLFLFLFLFFFKKKDTTDIDDISRHWQTTNLAFKKPQDSANPVIRRRHPRRMTLLAESGCPRQRPEWAF